MIAEAGLAALWLAAAFCALQLALAAIGLRKGRDDLIAAVRPVAVIQGLLTLASFLILAWLFVRSDMSVELVAANSHSAKPLMARIADTWGNLAGATLLGAAVLALGGALSARQHAATVGAQASIGLGVHAFLLLAADPFARMTPPAREGLNPLSQDPVQALTWFALPIGFAGLAIAFSLAAGALLTGKGIQKVIQPMRRWLLIGWMFLTIGIVVGVYANHANAASLLAWLVATALLHWPRVPAGESARTPLLTFGMMLAHLGIAVSLAGISANAAAGREVLATARFGDVLSIGPFRVTFMGVRPVAGPNWSALEGELRAVRGGPPMRLLPQTRFFADPPTGTGVAAVRTLWDGKLTAALGARDGDRWRIRLRWQPFATLIWLGGGMMVLGGLLSLIGRLRRERAAALEDSWL